MGGILSSRGILKKHPCAFLKPPKIIAVKQLLPLRRLEVLTSRLPSSVMKTSHFVLQSPLGGSSAFKATPCTGARARGCARPWVRPGCPSPLLSPPPTPRRLVREPEDKRNRKGRGRQHFQVPADVEDFTEQACPDVAASQSHSGPWSAGAGPLVSVSPLPCPSPFFLTPHGAPPLRRHLGSAVHQGSRCSRELQHVDRQTATTAPCTAATGWGAG